MLLSMLLTFIIILHNSSCKMKCKKVDIMKCYSVLLLLLLHALLIVPVEGNKGRGELTMSTSLMQETYAGESTLNGDLYVVTTEGKLYLISLDAINEQATISKLSHTGNGSLTISSSEGSGDGLETDNRLLYDVLYHNAYIATDSTIRIVHLNTSGLTTTRTLTAEDTVTSLKALSLSGDTYLLVTYTTSTDRGFVKRFRKYPTGWGDYSVPVLITSPSWYNLSRISNTILFKAADSLGDYDTLWAAVAERYTIYFTDMIGSTPREYYTPEPCDNIEHLVYSEHRQRMLVQCEEGTVLFNAKYKEFYALWTEAIGTVHISESGQFGAVIGQFITVLQLSDTYRAIHVNTTGAVLNPLFIDASPNNHYFCYTEQVNSTFSVNCIDIELLFENTTREEYSTTLLEATLYSPTFYSHQNLLTIQQTVCTKDTCTPLLQIYDMLTLTNTVNVTGIDATFLAFKARPVQAPTDPPTTTTPGGENTTEPSSTDNLTSTTHEPTTEPANTGKPIPTEGPSISTEATTQLTDSDMLMQCTRDLEHSNSAYEQLLWITIIMCCLFCLALIVTIALLVVVLCVASRLRHREGFKVSPNIGKPPAYSHQEHTQT